MNIPITSNMHRRLTRTPLLRKRHLLPIFQILRELITDNPRMHIPRREGINPNPQTRRGASQRPHQASHAPFGGVVLWCSWLVDVRCHGTCQNQAPVVASFVAAEVVGGEFDGVDYAG